MRITRQASGSQRVLNDQARRPQGGRAYPGVGLLRMRSAKCTATTVLVAIFAATIALSGAASAGTSWSCFHQKDAERRFTKKMNYSRNQHDLNKVNLDKQASRVARLHSKRMARDGALYHSSPTVLLERITREKLLSENVGRGAGVDSIHRAFMSSSGHKANVLRSNWRHVGVGTVASKGVMYVTVVFESRKDPGTTVKPPSC